MTGEPSRASAQPRTCPSCGEPVWAGDNFCESCRADLTTADRAGRCAFCESGIVSADGYCDSCGRKAPAARDHVQIDLGVLAGVTDRGLRHVRNEDAMALAAEPTPAGRTAIAVVCDGVSGSDRPDEAARAAADAALELLVAAARAGTDPAAASSQAVQAAQAAVAALQLAATESQLEAPSATFVSALVTQREVTVCWLGDSRAYWLDARSPAAAQRLTTDDSLAAEMVSAGLLSESDAMASPQAHMVTGWLGADGSLASPHLTRFTPPGPGVVLLCSDGLWNYEPDAGRLAARVQPSADTSLLPSARSLVEFALTAGGRDNITVALVLFPTDSANR